MISQFYFYPIYFLPNLFELIKNNMPIHVNVCGNQKKVCHKSLFVINDCYK